MKRAVMQKQGRILQQTGSVIIQALIATGIIGVVGLGAASLSTDLSNQAKIVRVREEAISVARLFGSAAATEFLCQNTIRKANGQPAISLATVGNGTGVKLRICIPQFATGGVCNGMSDGWFPGVNANQEAIIPGTNLKVTEIRFADATQNGLQFTGRMTVSVQPIDGAIGYMPLRPREATQNLTIMTDAGGNNIVGCSAPDNPEDFCNTLGGIWDETRTPPCQMSLPSGQCVNPDHAMVGVNVDGSPMCVNANVQCAPGANLVMDGFRIDKTGVTPNCVPVGAWDYSDFEPCGATVPYQQSRTVRCVNALAMDAWMRTNNFTTFQANPPGNIVINNSWCNPALTPVSTVACIPPPCLVPAGSTWAGANGAVCSSTADVTIAHATTGTLTDSIANPDIGAALFSCTNGTTNTSAYVSGSCNPVPPACVAGTSTSGAGGAAAPAGCFCNNVGETWNGSACLGAPPPPPIAACPPGFTHITPSPYGGTHACILKMPNPMSLSFPTTISAITTFGASPALTVNWTGTPYYCLPGFTVISASQCRLSFTLPPAFVAAAGGSLAQYNTWAATDGTIGFSWNGNLWDSSQPDPCPAPLSRGFSGSGATYTGFCAAQMTSIWSTNMAGFIQFDFMNNNDPGFYTFNPPPPIVCYDNVGWQRCNYKPQDPFPNPFGPDAPITIFSNWGRYSTKTFNYNNNVMGFTY